MVYIKSLEKEIFPCYVKPEKDELFSSWLCRLSQGHSVKTNTFIANYFGRDVPFWNRDIDVLAPEKISNLIEAHTPLNHDAIKKMFLKDYEGYAYDQYRTTGYIRNILPLGIKHRKRKQYGQQCCTKCLSKEIAYYKRSWRLMSSIACTDCNHLLIDRCFNCKSPIAFFRVNMITNSNLSTADFQPIYLCSACNTDLRNYVPDRAPSREEIIYQNYINETIERGYNNITQYSFTFFRVFFVLALRLRSSAKNNRFREIVIKNYQIDDYNIDKELRYWSLDQRINTFPFIYYLLNDPITLGNLFNEGKVIKAYLVKDKEYIPYWFEKLLIY